MNSDMSRLSNLLKMREIIQEVKRQDVYAQICQLTNHVEHQINDNLQQLQISLPKLQTSAIDQAVAVFLTEADGILTQIDRMISAQSNHWFQESYRRYEQNVIEDADSILSRSISIFDDILFVS